MFIMIITMSTTAISSSSHLTVMSTMCCVWSIVLSSIWAPLAISSLHTIRPSTTVSNFSVSSLIIALQFNYHQLQQCCRFPSATEQVSHRMNLSVNVTIITCHFWSLFCLKFSFKDQQTCTDSLFTISCMRATWYVLIIPDSLPYTMSNNYSTVPASTWSA